VADFLSETWVAELDRALRESPGLASDAPLVIEQVVRDAGRADHRYQVRFTPDGASVVHGARDAADVVVVTDVATAWAIHQGTRRAQDAFARGELKVRGQPELLSQRTDLFARVAAASASLRATTTPPDRTGTDGPPGPREDGAR
jgi:hypothetical protein